MFVDDHPAVMAISFTLIFGILIFGILINFEIAVSDPDCTDDNPRQEEDIRKENNCIKYCYQHNMWYIWGKQTECYWDDQPPKA